MATRVEAVEHLLQLLADELSERIARKVTADVLAALGHAPKERIPLGEVAEHGAPSKRWVEERGRSGAIRILGPRGARYVNADDLAALLERSSKAPRPRPAVLPEVTPERMREDVEKAYATLIERQRAKAAKRPPRT